LRGSVLRFLKGLDLCKNLSGAERMVMEQQVVRKVRVAAIGHQIEGSLVASAESYLSDSGRGARLAHESVFQPIHEKSVTAESYSACC
jgi:hypothetical protein